MCFPVSLRSSYVAFKRPKGAEKRSVPNLNKSCDYSETVRDRMSVTVNLVLKLNINLTLQCKGLVIYQT